MFRRRRKTIEERRSMVRVFVTKAAAFYIFMGSAGLIAAALWHPDSKGFDIAKDIFMSVLPIGTSIVTYWFANRSSSGRIDDPNNRQDNVNQDVGKPEHDVVKDKLVHKDTDPPRPPTP